MDAPLRVRVVTVSFNQRNWLERCLRSVTCALLEMQDRHGEVEVDHVIVDPGSSDGSRELVSAYAGHRVRIIAESDSGPADGLNRGFDGGDYDIGYFLNSDDLAMPGLFLSMLRASTVFPQASWYVSQGLKMLANGEVVRFGVSGFSPRLYTIGREVVFQQGTFFRRSLFERVGGFRIDNRTSWDGELFCRFALVEPPVVLREHIGIWRIQGEAITSSSGYVDRLRADHRRLHAELFGRSPSAFDYGYGRMRQAIRLIARGRVPR